jgi:N utilization substance protein B
MAGRRAARRTALFLLYQWDVTGQPLASLYEGEVDPFAQQLAEEVVANADELDRRLSEASEGWPADRLGALERNVLRIGIHELDRGEVPVEVAIDEAVTLAKRYSSDEALLTRLEQTRERLEAADDPDAAIDILAELAEIAKQVEAELEQARRDAGE